MFTVSGKESRREFEIFTKRTHRGVEVPPLAVETGFVNEGGESCEIYDWYSPFVTVRCRCSPVFRVTVISGEYSHKRDTERVTDLHVQESTKTLVSTYDIVQGSGGSGLPLLRS